MIITRTWIQVDSMAAISPQLVTQFVAKKGQKGLLKDSYNIWGKTPHETLHLHRTHTKRVLGLNHECFWAFLRKVKRGREPRSFAMAVTEWLKNGRSQGKWWKPFNPCSIKRRIEREFVLPLGKGLAAMRVWEREWMRVCACGYVGLRKCSCTFMCIRVYRYVHERYLKFYTHFHEIIVTRQNSCGYFVHSCADIYIIYTCFYRWKQTRTSK